MGLQDAFGREDRVEFKVSDLKTIFENEALASVKNTFLLNGIKAHLPYSHILIMAGEEDIACQAEDGKIFTGSVSADEINAGNDFPQEE